jgi:ribosome maturation factor RimP
VNTLENTIHQLLESTVSSVGCDLWGIEYLNTGHGALLRVYIEKDDQVTLNDCQAVSQQVSALLDVEDPIVENYTLEVSSPGSDRILFTLDQLRDYIGQTVRVAMKQLSQGKRNYTGALKAVEDDGITLVFQEQQLFLNLDQIAKVRLVPVS